ncbi:chromosomal replication initiator protein DnaA [Vallitalea okinawensis]|uniref:chromosomal replication initiator protein DnaA n=1 Tax=Vallitalea okinawensis TaxID=2078660 RepID=UPI000CFCFAB4|nr:chromosomal replication initiator protein DnaA [Vallitalea okinawensis]
MKDINTIWSNAMEVLQEDLTNVAFNAWFKDLKPLDLSDNTLIIETGNELAKDVIPNKYSDKILEILQEYDGNINNISIVLEGEYQKSTETKQTSINFNRQINNVNPTLNLNPKYTFDTFVEGNSNRLAYAASIAVADYPARAYNPLFIWGGSGLGKTHLMQSIGHYILDDDQSKKILYVSAETFMNELIASITKSTNSKFRDKYRKIDILLIDDIQFLGGKEGTQDEFFHTFNTLYEANKQIVISSDRPPEEIEKLEERIRSRFKWGLIVDIQQPDYETRVAILRKKAEQDNLTVDPAVFDYIATNVVSNIRELEGALTRILAFSKLVGPGRKIDLELAMEALKDFMFNDAHKAITVDLIQKVVAERYNLKSEDLTSKKRTRNIAFPRQIAMYLCRQLTELSLPQIGKEFGGRDHTTIIHGNEKITTDMKDNVELQKIIEDLTKQITGK